MRYSFVYDEPDWSITLMFENKKIFTIKVQIETEYNPEKIVDNKYVEDSYLEKFIYTKPLNVLIEYHDQEHLSKKWNPKNFLKITDMMIYSIVYFFIYTKYKCTLEDSLNIPTNKKLWTVEKFFNFMKKEIDTIKSFSDIENITSISDKLIYRMYNLLKFQFEPYIKNIEGLTRNIMNYMDKEKNNQIPDYSNIIDDPNAIIYCIGDLEGDLDMIYNWFLNKKFINERLDWIAPSNVYVLQLGDQLDVLASKSEDKNKPYIYRRMRHPSLRVYDFEVVLFFEYLRDASNNHVLSVLGNHDWMQTDLYVNDFELGGERDIRYKSRNDSLFSHLFDDGGLIYDILVRRPFIVRINNIIASHAGVSKDMINNIVIYAKESKQEVPFFDSIIIQVNDKKNLEDFKWYEKIVYPLIWNRDFADDKCTRSEDISRVITKLIPSTKKTFGVRLKIQQVIGHNTRNEVEVCKNEKGEIVLIKVDTGYISRGCNINTNKTTLKYAELTFNKDINMYNVDEKDYVYDCAVSKKVVKRPVLRFIDFI